MDEQITIVPNQQFRHDYGVFKKGKEYLVPPDLAAYFVGVGWADAKDYDFAAADTENLTTVPPADIRVDEKHNAIRAKVSEGQSALHLGRSPSGDLEIQDSNAGQEGSL